MLRAVLLIVLLPLVCGGLGCDHPASTAQDISQGEQVDLTKHLVPGKYTLFEFYANW